MAEERLDPRWEQGGVSVRGRWGDASFWCPSWCSPCGPLEAPARDVATSVCGGSCRIRSRRVAIPSESSLSSSSSSSSSGESSSDSPNASTWIDAPRALAARGSSSFPSSSLRPLWTYASPWRRAFSHAQHHPPSPEAWRTGRRLSLGKIGMNLRKIENRWDQQQRSSNNNSRDLPHRSSLPQASWGRRSPILAESHRRRPS